MIKPKRLKMKKIVISMAMVAMMVAMVSCGGRKPKAEVAVSDSTVVVADSVAADSVRVDSTVVLNRVSVCA